MQVSADGYHWSDPVELFPEYPVPEGFTKPGVEGKAHNLVAVMHQRMGWYVSSEGPSLCPGLLWRVPRPQRPQQRRQRHRARHP